MSQSTPRLIICRKRLPVDTTPAVEGRRRVAKFSDEPREITILSECQRVLVTRESFGDIEKKKHGLKAGVNDLEQCLNDLRGQGTTWAQQQIEA